jgi:hypothetical protein
VSIEANSWKQKNKFVASRLRLVKLAATGTARAAAAAATGATESVLFGISHVLDLKGINFQFVEFDG